MKPIFVVGPSGAGKTTLCKTLSETEVTITHVSFDEELKRLIEIPFPMPQERSGEEGREFWEFCKGVIERFSLATVSDITLLVDVNAGAEYLPECREYLIAQAGSLICIMADADVLYQREMERAAQNANPPEEKNAYMKREFSPEMQTLYNAAAITVDVSDNVLHTSLGSFKAAVKSLTGN